MGHIYIIKKILNLLIMYQNPRASNPTLYSNFLGCFFLFKREFQPMASALNDNSLSSNQNNNKFLV